MSHSDRRKSHLWNFFTIVDQELATCNVCQHKLSYKTSISNLKKHFDRKHNIGVDGLFKNEPSIPRKLQESCSFEEGEIEYDSLSSDSNVKGVEDTDGVPVIVEVTHSTETWTTKKSSPEQSERKCSSNSSSSQKQTNISELYERIAASTCSEEKTEDCAKEKHLNDIQEKHLLHSLQMECELKRKILQIELEMKKEELSFKKNLYRIQLDYERKEKNLKLKMLEQNLKINS